MHNDDRTELGAALDELKHALYDAFAPIALRILNGMLRVVNAALDRIIGR